MSETPKKRLRLDDLGLTPEGEFEEDVDPYQQDEEDEDFFENIGEEDEESEIEEAFSQVLNKYFHLKNTLTPEQIALLDEFYEKALYLIVPTEESAKAQEKNLEVKLLTIVSLILFLLTRADPEHLYLGGLTVVSATSAIYHQSVRIKHLSQVPKEFINEQRRLAWIADHLLDDVQDYRSGERLDEVDFPWIMECFQRAHYVHQLIKKHQRKRE